MNVSNTPKDKPRLPPGQRLVKGFPILDLGTRPEIPLEDWFLEVKGLVENPVRWTWDQFMAQPQTEVVADFHCVTTWSAYDYRWEGVLFSTLAQKVKPKPEARFIYVLSYDNYSTNLPLEVAMDKDVLLAWKWNEEPLPREHGGPVRLVVPKRYAWKSAKWIKEIHFLDHEIRGYWEQRGYSTSADPWLEERYG